MIGTVLGQSESKKINGIVQEYMASGNISAGGFVKYLEEIKKESDVEISSDKSSGVSVSAVALDSSRVFIAHCGGNSGYCLYATVCTVSNGEIMVGANTEISSDKGSTSQISAILLSDDKVFIAHSQGDDTYNKQLYGIVCEVNNNTITVGANTQISSSNYSGNKISCTKVSSNKVFIAHSYDKTTSSSGGSGYRIACVICTISGTTITVGTSKTISTTYYLGDNIETTTLSEDKVFVAYGSSDVLWTVICTISGTTITVRTATKISDASTSGSKMSIVGLSENKIFVTYADNCCVVCEINETTITVGNETVIHAQHTGSKSYTVLLSDNIVFIVNVVRDTSSSDFCLYGTLCTINGMEVMEQVNRQITSYNSTAPLVSVVAINQNNIFVAYTSTISYFLYSTICTIRELIATATQSDKIYRHSQNKSPRRTTCKSCYTKL